MPGCALWGANSRHSIPLFVPSWLPRTAGDSSGGSDPVGPLSADTPISRGNPPIPPLGAAGGTRVAPPLGEPCPPPFPGCPWWCHPCVSLGVPSPLPSLLSPARDPGSDPGSGSGRRGLAPAPNSGGSGVYLFWGRRARPGARRKLLLTQDFLNGVTENSRLAAAVSRAGIPGTVGWHGPAFPGM